MSLPNLRLSLQFADLQRAARHRAALQRPAVVRTLRHALVCPAEITVRVVDAEEGRALNSAYRRKNYATNILTFGYGREPLLTADLVLCAPVVAQEARQQGKTLARHYAHLLVHGALHAQGWDHEEDMQAQAMEARETEILNGLGWPNPHPRRRALP
ncbi:MAG: rRNA maturation RNase YbeY [Betaproteobacteria bacterium]